MELQVSPEPKRQRTATGSSSSSSSSTESHVSTSADISNTNRINTSSGGPVMSGPGMELGFEVGVAAPTPPVDEEEGVCIVSAHDPLHLSNIPVDKLYPEVVCAYGLLTCKGNVAPVVSVAPFVDVFDSVAATRFIDMNIFFLSAEAFQRSSLSYFLADTPTPAANNNNNITNNIASASASTTTTTTTTTNTNNNDNTTNNNDGDDADLVEALSVLDDIGPSLDAEAARQPWNLFS